MAAFSIARSTRRFRFNAGLGLATLIFFAGYVLVLTQLQRSTERSYAELRTSDPDRYLAEIQRSEGFRVYLREFRALKGYDTPQLLAPPFLIGRWALHTRPLRVDDAYVPPTCLDFVVIEDGHVRTGGAKTAAYDVRYVVEGVRVNAQRADGAPVAITPVGYGVHVNHIELTLPGETAPRYGYLCK